MPRGWGLAATKERTLSGKRYVASLRLATYPSPGSPRQKFSIKNLDISSLIRMKFCQWVNITWTNNQTKTYQTTK